jgi:hypothetical protein
MSDRIDLQSSGEDDEQFDFLKDYFLHVSSSGDEYDALREEAKSEKALSEDNVERETRQHRKDEHIWRKDYGDKLYALVVNWLSILAVVTILDGIISTVLLFFGRIPDKVHFSDVCFSDTLLIALWGAATASVLGLFLYVLKYFYRNRQ